ncbi:MAG: RNA polymerase sigma factor RpoE [Planctomycetota bacterium]|nr:MAG: RNA polymerase sigma factor RpoE [Planctomycetota bacterium]
MSVAAPRLRQMTHDAEEPVRPSREERDPRSQSALEDRVLAQRFLQARERGATPEMEAAFRMLLLRYQERIHKLVSRYTKDALEAEDVCQEVFLKLFRKLDSFQWDSALYTWLYRIAVNTAHDYVSKRRRRPVQLSDHVAGLVGSTEEPAGFVRRGRHEGEPHEPLFEKERAELTREILAQLPVQYEQVLVLREFEELSYIEISEVLECSIGTVESRLFRARARFRKILEQQYPELLS